MGCFTFVKFMMILFNFLIFLAGGTLLAVGIWVSVDGSSFLKMLGSFNTQAIKFVNVGFFCITVGGFLVLLGFLGCCGAHKESKCLLILFFAIILIIFIAEVGAGVVALAYSSFAGSILKAWAMPALQNQYGKEPVVTQMWNTAMTELKCCGLTNYTDFTNSYYYNQHGDSYPPTCCRVPSFNCSHEAAQNSDVQGCFKQVLSDLQNNSNIVGGVAIGIGLLEVAAMVVSMYLYCHLDKTSA